MAVKFTNGVNLQKTELQNAVIQNLSSAPSSPVEGQVYYDTTSDKFGCYQNGAWVYLGDGAAGSVTASSTTTFTNKTIDANGTGNSITNLEVADFAAASIVTAAEGITSNNNDTTIPTSAAVKAYADAAAAAIVDSAPGTLDTLNELAAALGDDANFASTTSTALGLKMVKTANLSDVANAATSFDNIKQAASTTYSGAVELAVAAEAEAKSSSTLAVTPASLANFPQKKTFTIGDGAATSIACTHNLGTKDVIVAVYTASGDEDVIADIVRTSTSVVTISFATAPTASQYKVVVIG